MEQPAAIPASTGTASPPAREALRAAIEALQAQRSALGDAVVDLALAPLLRQLAEASAAAPAAQQLRQAHILFLDVVGSTAASQRFDPESLHALMDEAMQHFSAVVRDHGGQVLQYAGDSLLAVWGAGVAHEGDAERAVCGGLALVEAARRQARRVAQVHGHDGFAVRVGIHTGPVLLGGGVAGEGNIRGQAVNVAARMEQSAPPFGLRISHDTQRLVRGLFDMTAQEPLAVKGIDLPMVTWLVHGQRPAALQDPRRGIDGLGVPMVGRDAPLAQLRACWAEALAADQPRLMWVDGEAGVGKSRLRAEFERELAMPPAAASGSEAPLRTLAARCGPQAALRTWGLLRDLLLPALGVTDGTEAQEARAALEQACEAMPDSLAADEPPATAAALLGQLLGLPCDDEPAVAALRRDGVQLRRRGLLVASALLGAAARGSPLLLVVEDAHWADPPSIEFLSTLPAALAGRAVGLLMLSRPLQAVIDAPAHPAAAALARLREGADCQITLSPLSAGESARLADTLLGCVRGAPASLRRLLVERADGNPFYMEELLQMLMDRGTLAPEPGDAEGVPRWRLVSDAPAALEVPPTLVGVLQARLDALPEAERAALLRASVVGALFWADALAALQPQAPAALPALARRELAQPRASSVFLDTAEWAFRHHLLHQVTYDNVLRAEKRAWHSQVAAWVERRAGDRQGEVLGLIAEHLERGGEDTRAAGFWVRAAEAAMARDATAEALEWAARAEVLDERADATAQRRVGEPDTPPAAGADERRRRAFAIAALRDAGAEKRADRPAQEAAVETQQRLAEALDDPELRARALIRRAWLHVRAGEHERGQAAAEAAIALQPDAATQAQAHNVALAAHYYRTQLTPARRHGEQGLACARTAGDRQTEGLLLNGLAVLASGNDLPRAIGLLEQSVACFRACGSRWTMSIPIGNLGLYRLELGRVAEAEGSLREALQLAREAGNVPTQARVHSTLARTLAELDRLDEAWEQAEACQARAQDSAGPELKALGLHAAALVHRLRGDAAAARQAALDSAALYRGAGQRGHAVGPAGEAILASVALGLLEPVRAELDELLADDATVDGFVEAWVPWCAWVALSALGDARAHAQLARAHARLLKNAEVAPEGPDRERWLNGQADRRAVRVAWAQHGS